MKSPHSVEAFPRSRLATIDVGKIARDRHRVISMLEIDVTDLRTALRARRRSGSPVSLLACFVKAVAIAITRVPQVHAVRRGRRRIVFNEIDIAVAVERTVDGQNVPIPVVIRSVDKINLEEIETEITKAMSQPINGPEDYQLGHRRSAVAMNLYFRLPGRLRLAIMRSLLRRPHLRKSNMGTVIVTSLGSVGRVPAWIVPTTIHNLAFGIGTIVKKPRVVGEAIVPRDVLHLTVSFDHDVIDGVPAGRFTQNLVRLLEDPAFVSLSE